MAVTNSAPHRIEKIAKVLAHIECQRKERHSVLDPTSPSYPFINTTTEDESNPEHKAPTSANVN
jgi:hypothetical protein